MSTKGTQGPLPVERRLLGIHPLVVLGILLSVLVLSLGDTAEIIPIFAPLVASPFFRFFHAIHDLLALGIVLYVAYKKYSGRLVVVVILLYSAAHIPYAIIEFSKEGPELVRSLVTAFAAIFGIWIINQLHKSEEKYRFQGEISQNMSEGVLVTRAANHAIVFTNTRFDEMFGYGQDELLGKHVSVLNASSVQTPQEVAGEIIQSLEENGTWSGEIHNIKKDGNTFWCQVNISTFEHPMYGTVWVAVRQDITDRKRATEKLLESENYYRTIIAAAIDGFWLVDGHGKLLEVNDSYSRMSGYSTQELLSMHISDIEAIETSGDTAVHMQKIMEQGSHNFESRHRRKDGSVFGVEISAQYRETDGGQFVVFLRDITERKRTEEALKQSESRLLAAQVVAKIGSWETDLLSLKVIWSEETYRIFELTRESFHQSHPSFLTFVHPDDRARVNSAFEKSFDTLSPNSIEHRIVTPSGIVKYVEEHWLIIHDDQERPIRAVGTCQDITERKKLQQQIMAQDRLVSIGQLVAGVAHEINNPLTSVIGFSELLLQRDLPDDVKSDLKIVNDEAQRAATIVKGLLTFSRKQTEGKEPIDINTPVQIVMKLNTHRFAVNNIQVNTHLAEGLPRIMGNSSQLQQVFFNIVMNAEQIMLEAHGKGIMTITTEQVGNIVRVSFADDGPGISPENMKKLFTPFFTTKVVGKGTGLGLSICHGIVTEHGGKIYAESELGKGATFIAELPISKTTYAPDAVKVQPP